MSFTKDLRGAASDLEGLIAFDTNRDGVLSALDERYSEFGVWQDVNGDGVSQTNEIFTLSVAKINSIGLQIQGRVVLDASNPSSQILGWSDVDGGLSTRAFDVAFKFEQVLGPRLCGCGGISSMYSELEPSMVIA